jgi:dihydrofolate synthase/folylpolyglutamate synthase
MARQPMSEAEAGEVLAAASRFGINPSLRTITRLCEALGQPQRAYRVVQVGGTNGKGSTARMTDALLRAHGSRSGVFVSPHLHSMTEHVLIDGEPVSGELFAAAVGVVAETVRALGDTLPEPPTQFELLTAAALWVLRDAGVEWAVLEVGMGGRWDSTSVAVPEVAVVTSVGLDHVEYLGPTLERIAWDKAHIIRAGAVAIVGPGTAEVDPVFADRAREVGARLVRVRLAEVAEPSDVTFTVTGEIDSPDGATTISVRIGDEEYGPLKVNGPGYQAGNAACALAAARFALGEPLDARAADSAYRELRIPGRFEVIARDPWIVADAAHNPSGARALADAVKHAFGGQKVTVVLGMLSDKDAASVARELAGIAERFITVRPESPRALDAAALAARVGEVTGGEPLVCESVADGLARARLSGAGVLVTGSVVTVAEARVEYGLSPQRRV